MEELSTLATGFEVDGGQLRFQLYIWLEKEVEVLRQLTNYGKDMEPLSRASSGRFGKPMIDKQLATCTWFSAVVS